MKSLWFNLLLTMLLRAVLITVPLPPDMEIRSADFIASYPKESACPKDGMPEFAFIGRSNVGKSSLINMLTARKGLAKVSGTPGKTRLLNFFLINKSWYLVDLPGYGYAKVSKSKQKELKSMINNYLLNRESLVMAFVLIDPNIPPTKIDLEFINGLGENEIPFALAFTKTDRMGKVAVVRNIEDFLKELSKNWETLPPYFITSSERRTGKEEILAYIESLAKKR
jgi:GTP-binding protein